MALAKLKQTDILVKSKEIEEYLVVKYKAPHTETFGGKIKIVQTKIKNQFMIDSIWTMIKMRNLVAHPTDFKLGLSEYDLFLAAYNYIKKEM